MNRSGVFFCQGVIFKAVLNKQLFLSCIFPYKQFNLITKEEQKISLQCGAISVGDGDNTKELPVVKKKKFYQRIWDSITNMVNTFGHQRGGLNKEKSAGTVEGE